MSEPGRAFGSAKRGPHLKSSLCHCGEFPCLIPQSFEHPQFLKVPLPPLQRDHLACRFRLTHHPFGVVTERTFAQNPLHDHERIDKQ
jgi:hypothetical protein